MGGVIGRVIARNPDIDPANITRDRRRIIEHTGTFEEVLSILIPDRVAHVHFECGKIEGIIPAELYARQLELEGRPLKVVQFIYPDLYD